MPFDMDGWGVDVAMSGSQKGLMSPPGLGFVAAMIARAMCIKRLGCARLIGTDREGEEHYRKYAGTPPEHLLYGLRQALDLLFEEGLENVFRRHRLLAEAVRRAVGVWAEGRVISFNIIEPIERCNTVTPVLTNGHDPDPIRAYCDEKCGVVLGHGIGELSGQGFRKHQCANDPWHIECCGDGAGSTGHSARQGWHPGGDRLAQSTSEGVGLRTRGVDWV
jgi:alanine-glyoxylate transaminase / serine-glyoxylate transaminase / serine-pyruvate transaminase